MSRARYLIAVDGTGVYLRRTICVIHHGENGEVEYHAKPVRPSQAPFKIRQAFHMAQKHLRPPENRSAKP